jgi:hypothetical protein
MVACQTPAAAPPAAQPSAQERPPALKAPAPAGEQPLPEVKDPPLALPNGQTPGDLLGPAPVPAPRLTAGELPTSVTVETDCGDLGPPDGALVKRVDVTLTGKLNGRVLQACLFRAAVERTDRVGHTGQRFELVAVWPGEGSKPGEVQTAEVVEASHGHSIPDKRQRNVEPAAWGSLIATGWSEAPVLAVLSARFYDGAWGEQVVWQRDARLLRRGPPGGWQPLLRREFVSTDLDALRGWCEGRPELGRADPAACAQAEQVGQTHEQGAADRASLRTQRLTAKAPAANAASDPDPQSLWLREAKAQLAANQPTAAIELALKVDGVCGEPVTEAHDLLRSAVQKTGQTMARVQPAQPQVALCEPLIDKPAPKRKADAPTKKDAPAKKDMPPGGGKSERQP